MSIRIKPFSAIDKPSCLAIFRDNVPDYFAANEEQDFIHFLNQPQPHYYVVCQGNEVVGCFGITEIQPGTSARVSWIMLARNQQGAGIGRAMVEKCIAIAKENNVQQLHIAASHKSERFFKKFGAKSQKVTPDGWGQGMHRVDMTLKLIY